jgi:large subunit ribosomal protein L31
MHTRIAVFSERMPHLSGSPRYRFTPLGATRRPRREDSSGMKPDIHPQYVVTTVTCSCGNTFTTRSTAKNGQIHVETCNACHPFYTGKQRVLDTAGRVAKFQQKYAKAQAKKAK